jgi:hypothetical protein
MMQAFDPVRFDAFAQLLARPDPTDLPRRAYVTVCEGDPNRRETRLPGILMGWLQRRHIEVDVEEPLAAAKKTRRGRLVNPGLRVLRRTGTDD